MPKVRCFFDCYVLHDGKPARMLQLNMVYLSVIAIFGLILLVITVVIGRVGVGCALTIGNDIGLL
ncbi:MAG: hypothetical protein CR994_07275 [Maribacter sp.]|nr:MAG: hypothetical protein CR994_07275 [Maribacter sp.]